jgi:hypothetical protein
MRVIGESLRDPFRSGTMAVKPIESGNSENWLASMQWPRP